MTTCAETFEFQAETKQLLDLMIHSLYTNKEIFLRELISNASDALDRLRFEALTRPDLLDDDRELAIRLETDRAARTLTIHDNGIGMSREEVISNIGTIAKSGTRELSARLAAGAAGASETAVPAELIGRFGVGFYACFMVAHRVSLVTRRAGQQSATRWESSGNGEYSLMEEEKAE
ncbi:MAG TPA: ATP-binding protein, partial [Pyrinomonadaceae bacterium]